jgi:putative transposase
VKQKRVNRPLALSAVPIISENTFYKWRQKYGGMEIAEARRLRELEKENARLKRLLAERDIEIDAMKEVLAKKW